MVRVTETAQFRPGKCALSEETQGPFIDTGKSVPRYGRVYISLKWLKEPLRELGFRSEEEIEDLIQERDKLSEEYDRLLGVEEDHKALVDAVTPYLPTPEAEVHEIKVVEYRKPDDDEIADWIKDHGGNHPVVRAARAPERGSTEEWQMLYGESGPQTRPQSTEVEPEDEQEDTTQPDASGEGPAKVVNIFEQDVDLDEVLNENVGDIVAFAEGKGEEFEDALVRREYFLAERDDRSLRKSLLREFGYWDDEEDEGLLPLDPGDDTTDEDEDSEEE